MGRGWYGVPSPAAMNVCLLQMSLIFSRDPVWSQTTCSGFRQQVFVMYHSTKPENVANILAKGFNISQQGQHGNPALMLGDGLYVSRDIEKTLTYGSVCFKLLVYPGKTFCVEAETTEAMRRCEWRQEFSSAWLPAGRNHTLPSSSGPVREETCVKSSSQVRILGIAYGHELLDFHTQSSLKNAFGTGDKLDSMDIPVLDLMLEELGIVYSTFVHLGSQLLLDAGRGGLLALAEWSGRKSQLWSRTWDNCLENKETGDVVTVLQGQTALRPVEGAGDPGQKWRLDGQGRLQHKASKLLLAGDGQGGVRLVGWGQGERENWKFRCLDQTKRQDTFVQFTPWHDMVEW